MTVRASTRQSRGRILAGRPGRASWQQRRGSERWAALALLLGFLASSCTTRLPLPDEPEAEGGPSGEIAYVVQYRWQEVPEFGDIVLASGILFAIEDSTRIHAYLSDKATAVINEGFSFPDPVVAGGVTLGRPVQMAVGTNKTLWVAFQQPDRRIVQFRIASPPVATGLWVRDERFREFGGIAADGDSGFVYVADAKANTIAKYAPSETGGARVALLASEGSGDHFVRVPRGIYCFGDSLLVADSDKSWLQVLDADVPFSGRGQVQGPADEPLVLHTPVDVWVDTSRRFYVAEQGRVLQITPEGRIKEIVTELDPQAAVLPRALTANTTQVWVPDPEKRQCTIYQINTAAEEVP